MRFGRDSHPLHEDQIGRGGVDGVVRRWSNWESDGQQPGKSRRYEYVTNLATTSA